MTMTKSRLLLSLMVIALAAVLIGGATMAWFTDDGELPATEFTAGTVIVEVGEEPTIIPMEGKSIDNVNPGDCAGVCWDIDYEGTKDAELRVKLYKNWIIDEDHYGEVMTPERLERLYEEYGVNSIEALAALLDTENVFYVLQPDSGWNMYAGGEDEGGEYIWFHRSVEGNFENDDFDGNVDLCLALLFGGAETDNKYQGATFIFGDEGSVVEAVQASNGAPEAVWGEDWDDFVVHTDYTEMLEGRECYGEGTTPVDPDPDPDPDPEDPEIANFKVQKKQAIPSNYHNNYTDVSAEIRNLVYDDNTSVTGPVEVTIKVGSQEKTITLNFNNGRANINNERVYGVRTGQSSNISIIINGITR